MTSCFYWWSLETIDSDLKQERYFLRVSDLDPPPPPFKMVCIFFWEGGFLAAVPGWIPKGNEIGWIAWKKKLKMWSSPIIIFKLTTRFPITTVARKKGTQTLDATHIQSHIDSIHSPHSTRKTIMKLCMKSVKFQRGIVLFGNLSMLSRNKLC